MNRKGHVIFPDPVDNLAVLVHHLHCGGFLALRAGGGSLQTEAWSVFTGYVSSHCRHCDQTCGIVYDGVAGVLGPHVVERHVQHQAPRTWDMVSGALLTSSDRQMWMMFGLMAD